MKKILVTGASSFLGHHVMPLLRHYALNIDPDGDGGNGRLGRLATPRFEILAPSSQELNLLDRFSVRHYIEHHKPDTILHMAAVCGGIGANKKAPAFFIHDNLKMACNLFDAIREVNHWFTMHEKTNQKPVVTHFYGLGSVCGYPKHCAVPFREETLWDGFPEETNAPYGTAKRTMLVMQQAFRQQFGLKGAHLIPVNMYGEHDHFDLQNSHVIPALINKFNTAIEEGKEEVEVWGDGTPTREFLYAGDCAKAIVKAVVTRLEYNDPINLGTGSDISIRDLAELIKEVTGFAGKLTFTGEVSVNGQPKRRLDVSRAKEVLEFEAKTTLREGLEKTVSWYKEYKDHTKGKPMEQQTTERTQTLNKLTEAIHLIENRMETLFDRIQKEPENTKLDYLFTKYMETFCNIADKMAALKQDDTRPFTGTVSVGDNAISNMREAVENIEAEIGIKPPKFTQKAKTIALEIEKIILRGDLQPEDVDKLLEHGVDADGIECYKARGHQDKEYWETMFKKAQYDRDVCGKPESDVLKDGKFPFIKAMPIEEYEKGRRAADRKKLIDQAKTVLSEIAEKKDEDKHMVIEGNALKEIWRSEKEKLKPAIGNETVQRLTKKILKAAGKQLELDMIKKEIDEVKIHPADANMLYDLISRLRFTSPAPVCQKKIKRDSLNTRIANLEQMIANIEEQKALASEARDQLRKKLTEELSEQTSTKEGRDQLRKKLTEEGEQYKFGNLEPSVNPDPIHFTYNSANSAGNKFYEKGTDNLVNPFDEAKTKMEAEKDAEKKVRKVPDARTSALDFMLRAGISRNKAEQMIEDGKRANKWQDEEFDKFQKKKLKLEDLANTIENVDPFDSDVEAEPVAKEKLPPLERLEDFSDASDAEVQEQRRKDMFKQVRAFESIDDDGSGPFRREQSADYSAPGGPRRLCDLEREFEQAVSKCARDLGVNFKGYRNSYTKDVKKGVPDFDKYFVPQGEVSDVEIMALAAMLDKEPPPPPPPPPQPEPEPIKTPEPVKVEKKKLTLFGKVKKAVSSVVKKVKKRVSR